MSLSVQYETLEEAEMRLNSTVVLYDGEPVYVSRIASAAPGDPKPDIFRVYAQPLPMDKLEGPNPREQFRKFISSKKFDLSTFKMGFMNKDGKIYYCSRKPRRQYKQGISNNTLCCEEVTAGPVNPYMDPRPNLQLSKLIYERCFVDMIKGVYPTFQDAVKLLENDDTSAVAFSREYALVKDTDLDGLFYLYHKQDKVGFILNDQINLAKKMKCLKEALVELGLKV